jgi:transposase
MSGKEARSFSREFKLAAIERLAAGESATALGRELGVRPTLIYQWRAVLRAGGAEALRRPGRPRASEAAAAQAPQSVEARDLASARRRIAELERKVGQQQLDLDFFKAALRRFEALRRPSNGPGATRSSPSSRR